MTIDRTKARTAKRTEVMERIGDRTNQKHKDLQILHISLENPQGWRISACDVENKNTSQDRRAQLRMSSARLAIKLDISTVYARARKGLNRESTLLRAPKTTMTTTQIRMESDNQIHHQG